MKPGDLSASAASATSLLHDFGLFPSLCCLSNTFGAQSMFLCSQRQDNWVQLSKS